jgi:hypothetical protein
MTGADQRGGELLEAARVILDRAGFNARIEALSESGSPWLLAEDELFAIGVVAGESLASLREVEDMASQELLARIGGLKGGPKRWDVYLVFLTTQRWSAVDDRERMEFEYDTRGIRRLIGAQLVPDEDETIEDPVEGVLRPFLPLAPPLRAGLTDLDNALEAALIVNGVDAQQAPRYVSAFRARGDLNDV